MAIDQAAGLREWASRHGRQGSSCPQHVAEALLALAKAGDMDMPAPPRPAAPEKRAVAEARESPRPAASPAATRRAAAGSRSSEQADVLVVVGLPGTQLYRVRQLLSHWHASGRRWVGRPDTWQLVPVIPGGAHLSLLLEQQSRWALWVEADAEGFRRAWRLLLALAEADACPRQMLAVHPPELSRRGLLENLQQAAAHYLGVELVVLA